MGEVVEFPGADMTPAAGPLFDPLPMPLDTPVTEVFGPPCEPRCYGCGDLLGDCTCHDEWFAHQKHSTGGRHG